MRENYIHKNFIEKWEGTHTFAEDCLLWHEATINETIYDAAVDENMVELFVY